MPTLYPFIFHPLLKERVWGGRELQRLYNKPLPEGVPIGESWEISDRPGDTSVVANGPLAGHDLRSLMEAYPRELLGRSQYSHFPLLIKILDAREKLSLQVHPPAAKAAALGGEPKTEMWYIAHADPGAELFVGLKRGITRGDFEEQLRAGTVEHCFHRVPVKSGDSMFLPSGRVHAIGAGLVIFEIQQNSDTTYRVFDWNRVGLDGKPRQLHIAQSLASIDFEDFEPALVIPERNGIEPGRFRLVADPLFTVELLQVNGNSSEVFSPGCMQILGVVSGHLSVRNGSETVSLAPGRFCLVPACLEHLSVEARNPTTLLTITA